MHVAAVILTTFSVQWIEVDLGTPPCILPFVQMQAMDEVALWGAPGGMGVCSFGTEAIGGMLNWWINSFLAGSAQATRIDDGT